MSLIRALLSEQVHVSPHATLPLPPLAAASLAGALLAALAPRPSPLAPRHSPLAFRRPIPLRVPS